MKTALPLLAILLLCSCSANHLHDGIYRANVFNGSMTWVNLEELQLNGNEMILTTRSVVDEKVLGEFKTSCEQYPDRVEFKNKGA